MNMQMLNSLINAAEDSAQAAQDATERAFYEGKAEALRQVLAHETKTMALARRLANESLYGIQQPA